MISTLFVCSNCDSQFPKWSGKCPECGKWGTLVEKATTKSTAKSPTKVPAGEIIALNDLTAEPTVRYPTGSKEMDRVLGGGIVPGSLILLGGDPGVGKSTLALQTAHDLASVGDKILYVSGEESAEQVALRLRRIAPDGTKVDFLAETNVETILATTEKRQPAVVVIDSIQTMSTGAADGEPGSIQQIRATTALLMDLAKRRRVACILVGHVTKEGVMAGPRALEHLVDVVLYLDGDALSSFRLLRSVKNRFGSTNETGVFAMTDRGLQEVAEPSKVFLADRRDAPGAVASIVLEGTRPFAVEIQALTAPTAFGNPRRTTSGIDINRLHLLLAVLMRRGGLKSLGAQDVFVNVVGGLTIRERASDAAVAIAVASSLNDITISSDTAAIGEIGLGGEIRQVPQFDRRIKELARLGFKTVFCPKQTPPKLPPGIKLNAIQNVQELLSFLKKG